MASQLNMKGDGSNFTLTHEGSNDLHLKTSDISTGNDINDIIGGQLFKGSNGEYVQNGDTIEPGTTHLRVLVGGKPTIVAMSPVSSGTVSSITETGATIGGIDVDFLIESCADIYTSLSSVNVGSTLKKAHNAAEIGGITYPLSASVNGSISEINLASKPYYLKTTQGDTVYLLDIKYHSFTKLSVKAFWAAGDDATDDTLCVQAAIDSDPTGGDVWFTYGTYIVDFIRLKRGTVLRGEGVWDDGSVILKQKPGANKTMIRLESDTGLNFFYGIENIAIDGNASEQQTFNVMVNLYGPHAIYLSNVYLYNSKGPSLRINNASFIQLDNVWQLLAELQSGQSGVELWGLDSGAVSGTCILKGVFASELNYPEGTVDPDPRNNPAHRARGLSIKNYETVTAQKIHIEGQGTPVYIDGCHCFVCDSVTGNSNGVDGNSAFFDFTGPSNGPKVFNIGSGANFNSTFTDWFKYSTLYNWRLTANEEIIGQQVSVQDGFGKANFGSKSVEFSNQLLIKDIGTFGAQLLLEHGSGTVGGIINAGSSTRLRHENIDSIELSTDRVKMNKPLGFAQLSGNPAIANGDAWYDPTDHRWKGLQNGVVVKFVTEP